MTSVLVGTPKVDTLEFIYKKEIKELLIRAATAIDLPVYWVSGGTDDPEEADWVAESGYLVAQHPMSEEQKARSNVPWSERVWNPLVDKLDFNTLLFSLLQRGFNVSLGMDDKAQKAFAIVSDKWVGVSLLEPVYTYAEESSACKDPICMALVRTASEIGDLKTRPEKLVLPEKPKVEDSW